MLSRLARFIMRHRFTIRDLGLIVLALLLVGFLCFETDVFLTEGSVGEAQKTLELDETLLLGGLLAVSLLLFAWVRVREVKREIARRIQSEQAYRVLASEDPLTGLANRRQFVEALDAALGAPPRAGAFHAMFMLDLNGFKGINDVYGHGAGDRTLIEIAKRLHGVGRQGDLVARLGGDEFAILAQHLAGPEAATNIARRVIAALNDPIEIDGNEHLVGSGIGVCMFPFAGANAPEVVRRADVALYRAKSQHRSAVRFYDEDMDQHVRERELLERELRAAVAKGAIEPHFQPLVDMASKAVIGFEALARWQHPTLGDVKPDRFIPVAEETGLIGELTEQLFRKACEAAVTWPAHVTLAFNISPTQLRDRTLGLRLITILGQAGLLPQRLEIEITESALVRDLEAAKDVLGALRDAGVRIALDDFGTGYSSLYHLRNFKVDKIKIDRSFIETMKSERESAEIVEALIGLGQGLGLTITAEGVETAEQEDALRATGCVQGQGFLFSQAVPADQTAEFFATPASKRKSGE